MTPDEHMKSDALLKCTFQPGSYDKRFVRDLRNFLPPEIRLSDKQAAFLQVLWHRYRRQIPAHSKDNCPVCQGKIVDPRTQAALNRMDAAESEKMEKWTKQAA